MARTRVFVSFDREHDADLVALLRAQAKRPDSTFEILPRAHGASAGETPEAVMRSEIQAADEVLVLCGEHTRDSKRVAAELGMAREESKPYLLIWGRREKMCTKPEGATANDAMYSWTRSILESQIAMVLENAKPRPVPENCKRAQA
ncbi:MAG: TIR domain-containing protein [Deltaproteobacteria bacterium]|nr:TIR domain-containing protein [Deltaproteobacteria bacterium]